MYIAPLRSFWAYLIVRCLLFEFPLHPLLYVPHCSVATIEVAPTVPRAACAPSCTDPSCANTGGCNKACPWPPPTPPCAQTRGVLCATGQPVAPDAPSRPSAGDACNAARPWPAPTPPRLQTRRMRATTHPCPPHAPSRENAGGACNNARPWPTPDAPSGSNVGGECNRAHPWPPTPDTPSRANAGGACNKARPWPPLRAPTHPRAQTRGCVQQGPLWPPTPPTPPHAQMRGECQQGPPMATPDAPSRANTGESATRHPWPPRRPLTRKCGGCM
jgi:hypothetical protein